MNAERLKACVPGTISVVGVLLLWQVLVKMGAVNAVLLPAPSAIFETLKTTLSSRTLLAPLGHTMALMFSGYAISCVLGISFGIAMGLSEAINKLFEPLVELFRPIPKPALIPPLYLFLGIGLKTMLFIVILASFFPILINTIQGVRGIDATLVATARTYRLSNTAVIFKIILPAALPMILTGMRVSLALALTLVIVAEMLIGDNGIGFLILDKQRSFQIKEMYVWLFVLAAVGLTLNSIFESVEKRLIPWRGRS